MSGIMMSSIASYPGSTPSGSILFGTTASYALTTGITAPGSDACTIEFWYYATSLSVSDNIPFNGWTNGNTRNGLLITLLTNQYVFAGPTSNLSTSGVIVPVINTWIHLAFTVAAGGAGNAYVNGVNRGSINVGSPSVSTDLSIGSRIFPSMLGYISNFRYVKGVVVYTGNFTVPTRPLTDTQSAGTNISAITAGQTQLLLNTVNGAGYLTDSSSYARTMTPTGTISSSALNPF